MAPGSAGQMRVDLSSLHRRLDQPRKRDLFAYAARRKRFDL